MTRERIDKQEVVCGPAVWWWSATIWRTPLSPTVVWKQLFQTVRTFPHWMWDVQTSGQCNSQSVEWLWLVIWSIRVNKMIHWFNNYNKLGFSCNLGMTFHCTVMRTIWFSTPASCKGEQRQHAVLITSRQQSAVIMAVRIESHLCTQFHNMKVIPVCHSDGCSSPVGGSPWLVFVTHWFLWIPLCS